MSKNKLIFWTILSFVFMLLNAYSGFNSFMAGSYGWALLSAALTVWMAYVTVQNVRELARRS